MTKKLINAWESVYLNGASIDEAIEILSEIKAKYGDGVFEINSDECFYTCQREENEAEYAHRMIMEQRRLNKEREEYERLKVKFGCVEVGE